MEKVKCRIKKDDKVKVISGKDRGKIRKVLSIDRKENRVMVENVNIVKRHQKAGPHSKQSGIIEGEAPIHASNVMIVCEKCAKPVRIKAKRLTDGKKVRICGKCGEFLET
ncbi:MAG: 50S ribosomal protein L24 [Desulfobacteraceae bacterium]|nr:50S ribosomal protein L24 [Desulfobacteraceae bacterium]